MMALILGFIRRLAAAVKKLLGPSFLPVVAIGSGLVGAGLWLAEHDARVRQTAELADLKKQTSANISTLEQQAAADMREANLARAQAVRELEGREQKLEQNAARLRDEIQGLESRKQAGLEQVAALPASELATRVAARLGLAPQEMAPRHRLQAAPGAAELPVGDQGSPGAAAADGEPAPAASLSEAAWRKIDSALVEGDACRSENAVLNQQTANLNDQVTARASMLGQQSAAIEKLNQALAAKDQVLAQTQAEHRAELKVARGTILGRAGRVVKYVALGVVLGLVIR